MPFASVNGPHRYYADTGGNTPAIVYSLGLLMDLALDESQALNFLC